MQSMWVEHLDDVYEELFLYGLIRKDTLEDHARDLRPFLLEKAREKELVDYDEAKEKIETSRQYLGRVLGAINECEHREGNPMLSAIVVRDKRIDGERRPSLGFFSWPCVRDRTDDCWSHPDESGEPSQAQLDFWEQERDAVQETWGAE